MRMNILIKFLPFVAAALLVASCSKDDNNGGTDSIVDQPSTTEPVPEPSTPDAPKTVTIPFSVKVDEGTSLSKITYAEVAGGEDSKVEKKVSRKFETSDKGVIKLHVEGDGITPVDLDLDYEGETGSESFFFHGDIEVAEGKEDEFSNGTITLTGTFTDTPSETPKKFSTSSLLDLEQNCVHTYKATFGSKDASLSLVDQNAYLEFHCATTQTKFQLSLNGGDPQDFTPDASSHKIWIAVPCGSNGKPKVKGNMICTKTEGKDLEVGTVYKVDRTNVIDLGPDCTVLWKTQNEGDGVSSPTDYGSYYNWNTACRTFGTSITPKEGSSYRLPTRAEFEDLVENVNGTGSGWQASSPQGWTFANDYGSVFFPAAGRAGGINAGSIGYYWSGEPYGGVDMASFLNFYSSGDAYVGDYPVDSKFSVRLVRGL